LTWTVGIGSIGAHRLEAYGTLMAYLARWQTHRSAKNAVPTASEATADSQGFRCAEAGELTDCPLASKCSGTSHKHDIQEPLANPFIGTKFFLARLAQGKRDGGTIVSASRSKREVPGSMREQLMKRILATILLTLTLFPVATLAQVAIRIGPPPPIVERPGPPPGARYVWVPGYHRWNGTRYVWVRGHYVIPPRRGAVWVPPHYDQRPGGYIFIAGHWR
jgi:hypothetical protein